ncbi:hypothetical protein C0J45_3064 [Silurus meridionalis]|uniref:Uncharacterized protein n=1 Tax=Silurus meridionalis TaxID=175797 RepID=A0A8T0BWP4_SILME|nr:hypothetical protein HF521_016640 [Silurus meridionalis]KAI5107426.1 hypothetical protein C0J45_3064 [Silurus meridionalis]
MEHSTCVNDSCFGKDRVHTECNVPNAVGLCALVISILLDIAIGSLVKSGNVDNKLGMMRRVFAEEKASGVRDSMEEYIKRLGMYLHQPTKALEETERLERQLSEQLTRLKNSCCMITR